jgi:hypothetical protein
MGETPFYSLVSVQEFREKKTEGQIQKTKQNFRSFYLQNENIRATT